LIHTNFILKVLILFPFKKKFWFFFTKKKKFDSLPFRKYGL